jgi:hypothetical protein
VELSAIVKEYNLPLTRSERDLVARLPAGMSALSGDQYEQRMKALAAARDVLKQLPDRQTTERQRRMEKAGMLKDRLKILRQTIPFLSPSAAKSLKSEMKQIASQLASLDAESGGGSGGAMPAPAATAAETAESGTEAGTAQNTTQQGVADRGGDGIQQKQHVSSERVLSVPGEKSGDGNGQDRQLKESVEELKSLYRAVLAALKRKQQAGSGQQLPFTHHLRVYAAIPDSAATVAVNV